MSTTQEPLKPCPFCGSEVEIERLGDHSRSTIYQCTNCGCSLETGEEWGHGRDWNRRAEDARLSAELEALRGKLAGVDEKALEAAAIALIDHDPSISGRHPIHVDYKRPIARAAIAAYLAAVRDKG